MVVLRSSGMISEHAPEPLPTPALRAALAVIRDAPLRDLPPVTDARLALKGTPGMLGRIHGRKGAVATNRTRNLGWRDHAKRSGRKPRSNAANVSRKAARLEQDARIAALWDKGLSVGEICREVGRSVTTVNEALRGHGVTARSGQAHAAISAKEFAARFAEIGHKALAAELGQSPDNTRKRARRMGLMP